MSVVGRQSLPERLTRGQDRGVEGERRWGGADEVAAAPRRAGQASTLVFAFGFRAFFVMKRSVFSWASLSTIWTGGDFIR